MCVSMMNVAITKRAGTHYVVKVLRTQDIDAEGTAEEHAGLSQYGRQMP